MLQIEPNLKLYFIMKTLHTNLKWNKAKQGKFQCIGTIHQFIGQFKRFRPYEF